MGGKLWRLNEKRQGALSSSLQKNIVRRGRLLYVCTCADFVHVKSCVQISRRLLQKYYQFIWNKGKHHLTVLLSVLPHLSRLNRLPLYGWKMLHDDICLSTWLFNLEVPPYFYRIFTITSLPVIRLTHTVLFVHLFYIVLNLARRVDQANRPSRNDDCLDVRKMCASLRQ